MHGLIKGNMQYVDSGKKTNNGKRIYNMPQWTLGYSTAIELTDDIQKISRYITKYITKDSKKILGNFYYAGGKGLQRCPQTTPYDTNYHNVHAEPYVKFGTGYKYLGLGGLNTELCEKNTSDLVDKSVSLCCFLSLGKSLSVYWG